MLPATSSTLSSARARGQAGGVASIALSRGRQPGLRGGGHVDEHACCDSPETLDFGFNDVTCMSLVPAYACGGMRFMVTTASSWQGEQAVSTAQPLATGRWVHVAVTLRDTVGTIYIDGAAAGSANGTLLTPWQLGARRKAGSAARSTARTLTSIGACRTCASAAAPCRPRKSPRCTPAHDPCAARSAAVLSYRMLGERRAPGSWRRSLDAHVRAVASSALAPRRSVHFKRFSWS
jgi:hypothetical protein